MENSCTSVFPNMRFMGTARMKYDKETEEVNKIRRVNKERSSAGTKKESPAGVTVARAYRPITPGVILLSMLIINESQHTFPRHAMH